MSSLPISSRMAGIVKSRYAVGTVAPEQPIANWLPNQKWEIVPSGVPSLCELQGAILEHYIITAKGYTYLQKRRRASAVEGEFHRLADKWYEETAMLSFIRQKAIHPAYQQIIGMGPDVLPLIFEELQKRGGDWLWALEAIARINPAKGVQNFKTAVDTWLDWGRENSLVE